jgi:hypothetical protein
MKRVLLAVAGVAVLGWSLNLARAESPAHRSIPVITADWSGHAAPVTPVWWRGGAWGYYGYPGVAVTTPYFSYYSGAPVYSYGSSPYYSYGYTTPYYYGGYYPYRYYGAYHPYYRGWWR